MHKETILILSRRVPRRRQAALGMRASESKDAPTSSTGFLQSVLSDQTLHGLRILLVEAARAVLARCPGAEVLVGGGIRDGKDLESLAGLGVRGALVATALHRGTIDRATLDASSS